MTNDQDERDRARLAMKASFYTAIDFLVGLCLFIAAMAMVGFTLLKMIF